MEKMNIFKFFFVVNIVVILIESVTIYLHQGSLGWLLLMILAMVIEVFAVASKKTETNED
jgi:hypothetical protein